jgi:hypothetical protein
MAEAASRGGSKILAWMCHRCPLCRYGREHPESLIGRVLHHPLHADHCPFWKAERTAYGDGKNSPGEFTKGS